MHNLVIKATLMMDNTMKMLIINNSHIISLCNVFRFDMPVDKSQWYGRIHLNWFCRLNNVPSNTVLTTVTSAEG